MVCRREPSKMWLINEPLNSRSVRQASGARLGTRIDVRPGPMVCPTKSLQLYQGVDMWHGYRLAITRRFLFFFGVQKQSSLKQPAVGSVDLKYLRVPVNQDLD